MTSTLASTSTTTTTTTIPPAPVDVTRWREVLVTEWGVVSQSGLNGVVSTEQGFVAVGSLHDSNSGNAAWTSEDGVTWSQVGCHRSEFGRGAGFLTDVESYASDVYAINWGELWFLDGGCMVQLDRSRSLFGRAHLSSIDATDRGLFISGRMVDTGEAGLWRSMDGATWERINSPSLGPVGSGTLEISEVAQLGDRLIAVGTQYWGNSTQGPSRAAIWVSDDGLAWDRLDRFNPDLGDFESRTIVGSIVAGPDRAFVGGRTSEGQVASITRIWEISADDGVSLIASGEGLPVPSIVTSSGLVVALGAEGEQGGSGFRIARGAIWTSEDGIEWTKVVTSSATGSSSWAVDVTEAEDGHLVAVGVLPLAGGGVYAGVAWTTRLPE